MADVGKMRFLARFPASKHAQIQQVVSYLEMCGLTGRDIISIGGYIDRQAAREVYLAARDRVQGYIDHGTIQPIGADSPKQIVNRFKYRGITGDYNCTIEDWHWTVKSMRTKVQHGYIPRARSWPRHLHWSDRCFYDMVLAIADGDLQLNF